MIKVGFKAFLNIVPSVVHSPTPPAASAPPPGTNPSTTTSPGPSFSLIFDENPLAEYVELPEEALERGLWFSNILCGVLRGCLEMVRPDIRALSVTVLSLIFCRFKCKSRLNSCPTCYEAMRRLRLRLHLFGISKRRFLLAMIKDWCLNMCESVALCSFFASVHTNLIYLSGGITGSQRVCPKLPRRC